jgi:hypothetical protein
MEKQTEEMSRAARDITEAVRELRVSVEKLAELQRSNVSGGLADEEADRVATEAVREVRAEIARERESAGEERLPPPTSEEVREWEQKRKERRRREDQRS